MAVGRLFALAISIGTSTIPAWAEVAGSADVARHVEAAKAAADSDLSSYLVLCRSSHPSYEAPQPDLAMQMKAPAPPPAKAFDNLYFVGSRWVSSWAIATSEGIV